MLSGDLALQDLVASCLLGMRAQVVAHRQVPDFAVAPGGAHVHVKGPRPLGRPGEEVALGRVGIGSEQVAETFQRLDVTLR